MESISSRLLRLRKANNLRQDEVARHINRSRVTVCNWENEERAPESMELRVLEAFAKIYNTTTKYIESGDLKYLKPQQKSVEIPLIDLNEVEKFIDGTLDSKFSLPSPPGETKGFYIQAPDDLMEYKGLTSIPKGAFVAINTDKTTLKDDQIYLINSPTLKEPIIRKLVKIEGSWEIKPENPSYQTDRFINQLTDKHQIIGCITGISSFNI